MRIAFVAVLAWAFATAASAQQTERVAGTIARVDGAVLTVDAGGRQVQVSLADNVSVVGVVRKGLADVKPGAFIGVGAIPQADGSQRAVRVNIFSESQRGQNEGHRAWVGAPQGTMTNATIDTSVASVDGQVLVVKYRDGEKRIVVTPETTILASVPGERSEIKPGAAILITQAVKKPDGTLEAARVNVGRDGVVP